MMWVHEVEHEWTRAALRFGQWYIGGPRLSNAEKLAVLTEEVGEVAEAIVQSIDNGRFVRGKHADNLREELLQVAAAAVAWAESIR